ncbi:transcriptional regulator, GntR family [Leptolyngbya sp. PCC 7375]|nr:transcriptional regulator, GntR family [Leptolyngbya sp. PCC 7375]
MFESKQPIYIQIANDLRQEIQHKVYQVGGKLPSQQKLGVQFGVNRHTVRQAVEVLQEEGLLRVENGVGIFVATPPMKYTIGKRVRYNEMLEAQGYSARYQLLGLTRAVATRKVAERLDLEPGADIAQYDLLGLSNENPLIVTTSYFPLTILPNVLEKLPTFSSISKLLREVYDYDHIRRRTLISSRPVKPKDAKLLQIAKNQHILLVQAINENQHGQAIEYTVTRFRSDSVELEFDA